MRLEIPDENKEFLGNLLNTNYKTFLLKRYVVWLLKIDGCQHNAKKGLEICIGLVLYLTRNNMLIRDLS